MINYIKRLFKPAAPVTPAAAPVTPAATPVTGRSGRVLLTGFVTIVLGVASIVFTVKYELKDLVKDIQNTQKRSEDNFQFWSAATTNMIGTARQQVNEEHERLKQHYDTLNTSIEKQLSFFETENQGMHSRVQSDFDLLLSTYDQFNRRIQRDFKVGDLRLLVQNEHVQNQNAFHSSIELFDQLVYAAVESPNVHLVDPSKQRLGFFELLNTYVDSLLTLERILDAQAYKHRLASLVKQIDAASAGPTNGWLTGSTNSISSVFTNRFDTQDESEEITSGPDRLKERHIYAGIRAKIILGKYAENPRKRATLFREATELLGRYKVEFTTESGIKNFYESLPSQVNYASGRLLPEDDYPAFLHPDQVQQFDLKRCKVYLAFLEGSMQRELGNEKEALVFFKLASDLEQDLWAYKWKPVDGVSVDDDSWVPYRFLLGDYMLYISLENRMTSDICTGDLSEIKKELDQFVPRLRRVVSLAGEISRYKNGPSFPRWAMGGYEYMLSYIVLKDHSIPPGLQLWKEMEDVQSQFANALRSLSDEQLYFLTEQQKLMSVERECFRVILNGYNTNAWHTNGVLGPLGGDPTAKATNAGPPHMLPYVCGLVKTVGYMTKLVSGETNDIEVAREYLRRGIADAKTDKRGYPAGLYLAIRLDLDRLTQSKCCICSTNAPLHD